MKTLFFSSDEWVNLYCRLKAYWLHDGNPLRPHALITSGLHSNGFFNSDLVIEHSRYLDLAAEDLITMFDPGEGRQKNSEFLSRAVHRVVGPAMGAITLAHDLALRIDHLTYNDCTSAFVEKIKDPVTGQKKMVFNRTNIKVGETILLCEDVLTTGGSVEMAENTVVSAGGTVMPYVLVLVNRSGLTEVNGKKIIALINSPMLTWDAEDCPLCKLGSEAILPKTPAENWVRLNARY